MPDQRSGGGGSQMKNLDPLDLGYLGGDFDFDLPPLSPRDQKAGILNELSIFAGTLAGMPNVVNMAQQQKERRAQQRQQDYMMELYAQVGASKLAAEEEELQRELLMDNLSYLESISQEATGDIDPAVAHTLTQAMMSGDQDLVGQILADLPPLNPSTVAGQKKYQQDLGEEMIAQMYAGQQQERAGLTSQAQAFGKAGGQAAGVQQYGGIMAGQRGREARATAAGTLGGKVQYATGHPEETAAYYKMTQPQMRKPRGAFDDTFLKGMGKEISSLESKAKAQFLRHPRSRMTDTPEELEQALQEYIRTHVSTAEKMNVAKKWGKQLITASQTDPDALSPTRVLAVMEALSGDPRAQAQWGRRFAMLAKNQGNEDVARMLADYSSFAPQFLGEFER